MLVSHTRFLDMPIMGLQTGKELAISDTPVIDKAALEIVAYKVDGPSLDIHPSYLRMEDIREISDVGIIIDSSDEFVARSDVISLSRLIDEDFSPVSMSVVDDTGSKLGKVQDIIIDTKTFRIEQLSVKLPFLQSFKNTELLIHRDQIVKIEDGQIVVASPSVTATESAPSPAYKNPFRSPPAPQPETIDQTRQ
jgi:uncharacterized protein YrrD